MQPYISLEVPKRGDKKWLELGCLFAPERKVFPSFSSISNSVSFYGLSSILVYQFLQHNVVFWMKSCMHFNKREGGSIGTDILVKGWRLVACVRNI